MKITRRLLAFPLVFVSLVCLFAAARAQEKPAAPRRYLVYVGTYTTKTNSKGIYAYSYDAGTGKIKAMGVAAEIAEFNGEKSGSVSAFSIDRRTGKLKLLNQAASRGAGPCHISLDKTGKYVLVANYDSGTVAVFPVQKDGQLGKYTGFAQHAGSSANKEREEGPHAHWIATSPDNRFLLAADLGIDRILISKFHLADGAFTPNKP